MPTVAQSLTLMFLMRASSPVTFTHGPSLPPVMTGVAPEPQAPAVALVVMFSWPVYVCSRCRSTWSPGRSVRAVDLRQCLERLAGAGPGVAVGAGQAVDVIGGSIGVRGRRRPRDGEERGCAQGGGREERGGQSGATSHRDDPIAGHDVGSSPQQRMSPAWSIPHANRVPDSTVTNRSSGALVTAPSPQQVSDSVATERADVTRAGGHRDEPGDRPAGAHRARCAPAGQCPGRAQPTGELVPGRHRTEAFPAVASLRSRCPNSPASGSGAGRRCGSLRRTPRRTGRPARSPARRCCCPSSRSFRQGSGRRSGCRRRRPTV